MLFPKASFPWSSHRTLKRQASEVYPRMLLSPSFLGTSIVVTQWPIPSKAHEMISLVVIEKRHIAKTQWCNLVGCKQPLHSCPLSFIKQQPGYSWNFVTKALSSQSGGLKNMFSNVRFYGSNPEPLGPPTSHLGFYIECSWQEAYWIIFSSLHYHEHGFFCFFLSFPFLFLRGKGEGGKYMAFNSSIFTSRKANAVKGPCFK